MKNDNTKLWFEIVEKWLHNPNEQLICPNDGIGILKIRKEEFPQFQKRVIQLDCEYCKEHMEFLQKINS